MSLYEELKGNAPAWVREFIDGSRWNFAKTYAKFCPHEYALLKQSTNPKAFQAFGQFIIDNGFKARYGKKDLQPYWIDPDGDYYYFILDCQLDENGNFKQGEDLINRARKDLWELYEYTDLFGSEYRFRYMPYKERLEKGLVTE